MHKSYLLSFLLVIVAFFIFSACTAQSPLSSESSVTNQEFTQENDIDASLAVPDINTKLETIYYDDDE
jgi:outer membrane biogenesis lipoprotein LolB